MAEHTRIQPRVLVVEDDPDIREVLCELLADEGYTVFAASDGGEAFELARCNAPHVILLDLRMSGTDGWTFLELRRQDPVLSATPVVVVSAHAGRSREAPYVGVAAVIAKPFVPDVLLKTVAQLAQSGQPAQR